jgi:hypothetical protein
MSEFPDDPYSAPTAELGRPIQDAPSNRTSWLWYLTCWTFMICVNASVGFALSLLCGFVTPAAIAATLMGVAVIGTAYAAAEFWARRWGDTLLADMLLEGAKRRILFIFIPFAEIVAFHISIAILGIPLPEEFRPMQNPSNPVVAFLMTLLVGTQLAFMALALGALSVPYKNMDR